MVVNRHLESVGAVFAASIHVLKAARVDLHLSEGRRCHVICGDFNAIQPESAVSRQNSHRQGRIVSDACDRPVHIHRADIGVIDDNAAAFTHQHPALHTRDAGNEVGTVVDRRILQSCRA